MTGGLCINSIFTPTQSDFYWSSSTFQSNPSDAWYVSFNYGYVYGGVKSYSFDVRCVRGGP